MNWLQRLFAGPPRPGGSTSDVERESRAWIVEHRRCGHRSNVWEMGGIRYKAHGTKWSLLRCKGCGKLGWMKIHRPR